MNYGHSVAAKLSRWAVLSWPERRLLLLSAFVLPVIVVALRMSGLPRVLAMWGGTARKNAGSRDSLDVEAIASIVSMAANTLPFGVTCLARSVLLQWLLKREGRDGQLRIGVRRPDGGGLTAHAWVECDGVPVGDPQAQRGHVPFEAKL